MQYNYNFNEIENHIFNFVDNHTTAKQVQQAQELLDKPDLLLIYILSAYNMYEITHYGGMRMITNPEAFLPSEEEKNAFIQELKKYVINALTYNYEGKEVKHYEHDSYCSDPQNTQD